MHTPFSRTCEINKSNQKQIVPIEQMRDQHAYILLGDPGMGKTSVFKNEYATLGASAEFYSVKDFLIRYSRATAEQVKEKTFFIDGLDEVRAGKDSAVIERLRETLFNLGQPRFRLSCRAADWLGGTDYADFSQLLPSGSELLIAYLQPLNTEQIHQYLQDLGIEPAAYIQQAEKHGLDDMLSNPQTLGMLSNAIHADGVWPESRGEVFELACRKLATEHNERHQQSDHVFSIDQLLSAAGYGLAIMLLADKRIISTRGAESHEVISYLHTQGIQQPDLPLPAALKTRLFVGITDQSDYFDYLHRSIAEFLAARFLAHQIAKGLPLGRVLALMCGNDGGVISGLRGLYAWLAVCISPDLRKTIITHDPLAVVLYGDVKRFSVQSKCDVIAALHEQAKQYPSFRWHGHSYGQQEPFAALATNDMVEHFRAYLDPLPSDPDRQALASCLLNAIEYGDSMPALQSCLLAIVRNEKNWSGVRRYALDALLAVDSNTDVVLCLLEQINSDEVQTDDDELLGNILTALYPARIGAEKIFQYLKTEKDTRTIGVYHTFWRYTLPDNSRIEDLPFLLNYLFSCDISLDPKFEELFGHSNMIGKLLLKALNLLGNDLSTEQLYNWLISEKRVSYNKESKEGIQEWFDERPDTFKALILHSLRNSKANNPFKSFWILGHAIQMPSRLYQWILDSVDNPTCGDIKFCLFQIAKARLEHANCNENYGLNELFTCADRHPDLLPLLQNLYCDLDCEEWRWQHENGVDSAIRRKAKQAKLEGFRNIVTEQSDNLLAGTAPFGLIADLGRIYRRALQQGSQHASVSPSEVLAERFDGDKDLTRTAIAGICTVLLRNDLPTAQQVFESSLQGHYSRAIDPCFAAAKELSIHRITDFLALPDSALDLLIAFHLTGHSSGDDAWYPMLVKEKSDRIVKGYRDYLQLYLPSGRAINNLYPLAHDAAYADIAKQIVPFALKNLPSIRQPVAWGTLCGLWQAGVMHCDAELLSQWLNQRLAQSNIQRIEKSRLLALTLYWDAECYLSQIDDFASSNSRKRLLGLAIFSVSDRRETVASKPKSVAVLLSLITILGAVFKEYWNYSGFVRPEQELSSDIRGFFNQLANNPEAEARVALEQLVTNPALVAWNEEIKSAIFNQKINSRNRNFSYPSPAAVVATLANLRPANAADLQALVLAHLLDLADNARNSSADAFKQFWNETPAGKADIPKAEESGRDVLLQWMRDRLARLQLEVLEEGQYADDKRADISVHDINLKAKLPIEIKRSQHVEVWTAVRKQLVPRYARDPSAYGFGIYLVLWFGAEYMGKIHPISRTRPETAQQLQEMLEADLNDQERSKVKICVFDVSKNAN